MLAPFEKLDASTRGDQRRRAAAASGSPTHITLLSELDFIPQRDRRMLELRFRVGLTLESIAALTGLSRSAVSRRLSAVSQRLHHPLVEALQQHPAVFAKAEVEIAMRHFAGGQGVARIATQFGVSRPYVALVLATVRGWHHHVRTQAAWPSVPAGRADSGNTQPAIPPRSATAAATQCTWSHASS